MDTTLLLVLGVVLVAGVVGLVVATRRRPDSEDTVAVDQSASAEAKTPTRTGLSAALKRVLGSKLDEDTWAALEEALIAADVGVMASAEIVERVKATRPEDAVAAKSALAEAIKSEFAGKDRGLALQGSPAVVLVVGVNGTGKTTTIAKLTNTLQEAGKSVTLAAGDTFRAAAAEQLMTWGDRLGAQVVKGQEGGDPASVAYDALESARAKGVDVVIVDTAGRLHGKKNLMAELQKIHRVSGGEDVNEVLLVLDATSGQNGLAQVTQFSEAVPLTGIVLSKLDGTARGGIVVAVERSLGVPVKFVGIGEGIGDLEPFDPDSFVDSLLD